ncbi:hypothetical protein TNCV_2866181 [Trichonephila clavipes]|nr:hypothetical protein TNCV_2866181 [Trichonephila clavipes]
MYYYGEALKLRDTSEHVHYPNKNLGVSNRIVQCSNKTESTRFENRVTPISSIRTGTIDWKTFTPDKISDISITYAYICCDNEQKRPIYKPVKSSIPPSAMVAPGPEIVAGGDDVLITTIPEHKTRRALSPLLIMPYF